MMILSQLYGMNCFVFNMILINQFNCRGFKQANSQAGPMPAHSFPIILNAISPGIQAFNEGLCYYYSLEC